MQYIHLNNDTFIMHTPNGAEQVTSKSFNFHKIVKAVKDGAGYNEISHLLEVPDTSDGILELYKVKDAHKMVFKLFREDFTSDAYTTLDDKRTPYRDDHVDFIGVYVSKEGILEDWPEYGI